MFAILSNLNYKSNYLHYCSTMDQSEPMLTSDEESSSSGEEEKVHRITKTSIALIIYHF